MSTSQSHGHMFETTLEILLFITFRREKTYVQDVLDHVVTGASYRTVQRYMKSLENLGYVESDCKKNSPQSFIPTLKAKQLFGVKA
jgi:DNA-binding IclR family transcriptional regulator